MYPRKYTSDGNARKKRESGVALSQYRIVKIESLLSHEICESADLVLGRKDILFEEALHHLYISHSFEASELYARERSDIRERAGYFPSDETFRRNTRDNFVKSALRRVAREFEEYPGGTATVLSAKHKYRKGRLIGGGMVKSFLQFNDLLV